MRAAIGTSVVLTPLLSILVILSVVSCVQSAASVQQTSSQTTLMQQSDHQQRMRDQRAQRADERQIAAIVAATESPSSGFDYLALVILIGSVVTLVFVSRRRRKSRFRG